MNREMTVSEQFVHDLAQAACLRLWTYTSPQGKEPGKELCDTLVACPPDLVVISVKEIEFQDDTEDREIAVTRWKRKAVDQSVHQVYGAVRRLQSVENVVKTDGSAGVNLGPVDSRRIHRVAVAIGSEGHFIPLESRDFGHGFVHVFDAESFLIVMQELDTIGDLVQYLADRQHLLTTGLRGRLIGSEEDFLALYIRNTRSFAPLLESNTHLTILDGIWDGFRASDEYRRRAEANSESYIWDRLIEVLHDDHLNDNMEFGGDLNSIDETTRVMARENRTERRALAQQFIDFMDRADLKSRLVMSSSGTTYVFLKAPHAEDREYRTRELQARAWVARAEMHKQGRDGPVLGLATEVREPSSGFSLDAVLLRKPDWTEDDAAFVERMRADHDLFADAVLRHERVDEFPAHHADTR